MKILLKSEILTVTKVKKTSAKFLKDLVVGDKIQLRVDASPVGSNRSTYATYITVENVKTGEVRQYSFNQISILYNVIEF